MFTKIIDFHTHAFPDEVAAKAIPQLEAGAKVKAFHDGRISSLLASMEQAGITTSVVCSIATKPTQFLPILNWSQGIASKQLVPLASVHPEDPELVAHLKQVKASGLKGIKLHPYYQSFRLDEKRLWPLYEACQELGLMLVCHTGFDIAFPPERLADPQKIKEILKSFPHLLFIATHTGAWRDWDEVVKHILGKEIYVEISYTIGYLSDAELASLLQKHPADFLLFGTDSPWDDQSRALKHFLRLPISESLKEKMLYQNAARLLGLTD